MLTDRQGQVVVSTDNGLAVTGPDTFAVRALRRADEVAIAIYGANSGDVTRQGELVSGGVGGMTVVQPGTIATWRYRPPVVVTDIRIGGKSVLIGPAGGSGADADTPWRQIMPDANSLAVEFSAVDYSEPERNSYRLDGFDCDRVETDATRRVAACTNLPVGDYTLQLSGSNRNRTWTGRTAVLRIRVLPAWYQTLWFRIGEIVAAFPLVTALAQGWTLILRRRQHELERQGAERTAEFSASQQQMQQFAYLGALTALPNRRAFNEEFRTLIDTRPQRTGGVRQAGERYAGPQCRGRAAGRGGRADARGRFRGAAGWRRVRDPAACGAGPGPGGSGLPADRLQHGGPDHDQGCEGKDRRQRGGGAGIVMAWFRPLDSRAGRCHAPDESRPRISRRRAAARASIAAPR